MFWAIRLLLCLLLLVKERAALGVSGGGFG